MATDAIERARARKAAEEIVRKLDLIMKHLGIVDPLAKSEEVPVEVKPDPSVTQDPPAGDPPPSEPAAESVEAVTSAPAEKKVKK